MENNNLPSNQNSGNHVSLSNAANIFNTRSVALSPTSYSARVTTANPCAFVLLLDQSGSMDTDITTNRGENINKAKYISITVNKFLEEILLTCIKDRVLKNYFEILIIGYGKVNDDEISIVDISWDGALKNKDWITVNELRNNPLRKEVLTIPNTKRFGPSTLQEELNIWIEPFSEGTTPMKEAFELCEHYLMKWVENHPDSFPPMVFNITDGDATDIDEYDELIEAANKIKAISTSDGNSLLFNMLLTENTNSFIEFPRLEDRNLFEENDYELALFDASSIIPESIKEKVAFLNKNSDVKALVLGEISSALKFLNIGTSTLGNNI